MINRLILAGVVGLCIAGAWRGGGVDRQRHRAAVASCETGAQPRRPVPISTEPTPAPQPGGQETTPALDRKERPASKLPAGSPGRAWADVRGRIERARERLNSGRRRAAIEAHAAGLQRRGGAEATVGSLGTDELEVERPPAIIVPFHPDDPSAPATLPAALATMPEESGLSPEQQRGVDQMATDFLEAVADPHADPTDPAYQERWRRAQLSSDDLFRLRYGDYAWLVRHIEAHRQALREQAGP